MSEKRFTYGETIDYNFFDVFEEKKYLGMVQRDSTKIVDRLNELAEENEQLKQKVDFYKYFQKDARELEKENEQLRQKLDFYLLDEFEWKEKYGD